MTISPNKFKYCPVCGYDWGEDIMFVKNDGILDFSEIYYYDICPCCGGEYGFDIQIRGEDTTTTFRNEWIKNSRMIYRRISDNVNNYNPIIQLKNINIDLTNPTVITEYKKEIPNIEEILMKWTDKQ